MAADSTWNPVLTTEAAAAAAPRAARHAALVRATHWITTLCFFALLVTGVEILISHPRFYWGETGNVLMPSLFDIPIPASRRAVNTGYSYVLKDQNGWSRSLHFQSAWLLVFTGLLYGVWSLVSGHFRRDLLPARPAPAPGGDGDGGESSWGAALAREVVSHLRFQRPGAAEAWSYNMLQRLTYMAVICILFPLIVWTGLAMSPAFVSAFPAAVTIFGGQQSARTIHFFVTVSLVVFVLVHVTMIFRAGFGNRMRAMITGSAGGEEKHS